MCIYNIVYRTKNLVNGKLYIGIHRSINKEDNYLGSNKHLKRAIKKYGRENFIRENLFYCDSEQEMFEIEEILVDEAFIEREDTYNIVKGGKGWCDLGNFVTINKLGIHSLTFEERSLYSKRNQANIDPIKRKKMCSDGGKIGSRVAMNNKTGIFGLTYKQRKINSELGINSLRKSKKGLFDNNIQSEMGKRGGPKNKGFKHYNDGVNGFKYTKREQDILPFEDFLKMNPQFNPGRLKNSNDCADRKWVNNGIENKRIKIQELDVFLSNNPDFIIGKTGYKQKTERK